MPQQYAINLYTKSRINRSNGSSAIANPPTTASNSSDLPPQYDEVVEINAPAVAHGPVFGIDFGNASTITICKEKAKPHPKYGPYKFSIGEPNTDAWQLHGEVTYGGLTTIIDIDGIPLMTVKKITGSDARFIKDKEFQPMCNQFQVISKNSSLGVLIFGPNQKLTFVNEQRNKPYSLQLNKTETEIIIARIDHNSHEVNLGTITLPEYNAEQLFECCIGFTAGIEHDLPLVTMEEKELIASVAVAFMANRSDSVLTQREYLLITLLCWFIIIAFGVGAYLFIKYRI